MIKKSTDVSLTLLNKCNSSIDHCRTVPWKEYLLSVGCPLPLAFFLPIVFTVIIIVLFLAWRLPEIHVMFKIIIMAIKRKH